MLFEDRRILNKGFSLFISVELCDSGYLYFIKQSMENITIKKETTNLFALNNFFEFKNESKLYR